MMDLNIVKKLQTFYEESRRVLGVSYKPTQDVFRRTLKIVLLGVLILGVLGFIISEIITFITG